MSLIIDSTNHGRPELLRVDIQRLLKDQATWDEAIPHLVDSANRRRVQNEIWAKIVLPLAAENSIDLKLVRSDDGYLYSNESEVGDPYAIEGCMTASS